MEIDKAAAVVVRAWKDESFYASLPDEVQAAVPPKPENFEHLSEEQIEQVAGGSIPGPVILTWARASIGLGGIGIASIAEGIEAFETDD